jgi:hypothetical protein
MIEPGNDEVTAIIELVDRILDATPTTPHGGPASRRALRALGQRHPDCRIFVDHKLATVP